jgi:hypothetical protein
MRTVLIHNPEEPDQLDSFSDIQFTHHLELYAFPEGEVPETPYVAIHVATIDLPPFKVQLNRGIMPVRLGARTDPPPRQSFARFPLHAPPPFAPEPSSGIAIFEIHCHSIVLHAEQPHYVLFMLKSTLLRYMPAPTSPLLKETWSRPIPVISWDKIAPYSRMLGPQMERPSEYK